MLRWILLFMLALAGGVQAQSFRDCPSCPEMVNLPPGAFTMGPAAGEEDREGVPEKNRDGPAHRVTIGYGFAIGKYEVTRAEFSAFVVATGWQTGNSCWSYGADGKRAHVAGRSWRDPGFVQTERDPVVCVSWDDAKAYVAWLRQTTGRDYRLPSEAEWEYAARAGSQGSHYWGDNRDEACRYGNFADLTSASALNRTQNSENTFLCPDGYVYTAPVGTFQPNAFGLHDMLGNAWEWTEDCSNARYDGTPVDGRVWLAGDCNKRMLRGGSWCGIFPWLARSAFRDRGPVGLRSSAVGFRVARTF